MFKYFFKNFFIYFKIKIYKLLRIILHIFNKSFINILLDIKEIIISNS